MLILTVNVIIKTGHEEEVLEPLRKLEAATRLEPGSLAYVVQRSRENRRHYLVYERIASPGAKESSGGGEKRADTRPSARPGPWKPGADHPWRKRVVS